MFLHTGNPNMLSAPRYTNCIAHHMQVALDQALECLSVLLCQGRLMVLSA